MELLKIFLKTKTKTITEYVIFIIVFLVSFILSNLPLRAVIYPTMLCILLGIIFQAVRFLKFKKKYKTLEQIKFLTAATIQDMPEADDVNEESYQRIIENLKAEAAHIEYISNAKFRDVTEYYSVWAHQIKTPIASMKLTLQNEDSLVARRLSAELFRIEQYVEMVLAFLRLDSESSDYVFREHDIDEIIKQSVKKFASDFIGKKIRLEYEPLNEKIITDEKWFAFVIEQILSNSLKYTREGSVKIYMSDPHKLCITDTGIGIASADLPRIFENGYTGFNGRVDKSASGIGLYLCKRICTKLGIDISAESEPEKGTTICLDLSQYKLKRE